MSKVFVSFDYDNDKHYKFLLQAWHHNPKFQFTFEDGTPSEINSLNVGRVKATLTAKIKEATHTLVIVGQHANQPHRHRDLIGYRNWINFEIAKSIELGKRLVAVKLNRNYESPEKLLSSNAYWAYSFNEQSIINALEAAPYPPIRRYV